MKKLLIPLTCLLGLAIFTIDAVKETKKRKKGSKKHTMHKGTRKARIVECCPEKCPKKCPKKCCPKRKRCPKRCPKKCCPKRKRCCKPKCPKKCCLVKHSICPKPCVTTCVKTCCDTKRCVTERKTVPVDVVKFKAVEYEEPEYTTETRLQPVKFTVTKMVEHEVPVTKMVKKTRLEPVIVQEKQTVCATSEVLGEPCCEERAVTRCAKPLPRCR